VLGEAAKLEAIRLPSRSRRGRRLEVQVASDVEDASSLYAAALALPITK